MGHVGGNVTAMTVVVHEEDVGGSDKAEVITWV